MVSRLLPALAAAGLSGVCLAQSPQPPASPAPATPAAKAAPEPYHAMIARDGVELRCGAGTFYYPVAALKAGTLVKVLGEDSGWLKVAYPEGLRVLLRAEDVTADASGKSVRLAKPGSLLHANLNGGAAAAWSRVVLEHEPRPGTELVVLDTTKKSDGVVSHYAVAAPAGTFGYVNRDLARRLSPEEYAAAIAKPAVPAPTTPPTAPATATPSGETPASVPMTPINPMPQDGTPGAAPPADAPSTPPAAAPIAPVVPAAPKIDPRVAETAALAALFKRIQAQGPEEAEFEQAIVAFNDAIAKAGTGLADRRYADHLRKYVEVLQLRKDLRDANRRAATGTQALEARHADISRQLAELEKLSVYRVIGKLLSSTVYDGTRLPKLFRVVSPEPGSGRTLAYVQPAEGLDLEGKLGRIVGIVGDSRLEESLRANLVTPKRVDVLSLASLEAASPTNAPAAKPAQPAGGQ